MHRSLPGKNRMFIYYLRRLLGRVTLPSTSPAMKALSQQPLLSVPPLHSLHHLQQDVGVLSPQQPICLPRRHPIVEMPSETLPSSWEVQWLLLLAVSALILHLLLVTPRSKGKGGGDGSFVPGKGGWFHASTNETILLAPRLKNLIFN